MGHHIDIRRFQPGDGERIRALNELAMATTPEYVPEAPDEDLQAIQQSYLADGGEFLVGTVGDTIVATGAYVAPNEWKAEYVALDSNTAELTRMRVDPEWHGRGFGSALYSELKQRAWSDGYQRFVLDTGTENDVARGFYEYLGFECQKELSVDFADSTIELALYEKSIAD
jgi:GNAT superfamily N-acetyltransferase